MLKKFYFGLVSLPRPFGFWFAGVVGLSRGFRWELWWFVNYQTGWRRLRRIFNHQLSWWRWDRCVLECVFRYVWGKFIWLQQFSEESEANCCGTLDWIQESGLKLWNRKGFIEFIERFLQIRLSPSSGSPIAKVVCREVCWLCSGLGYLWWSAIWRDWPITMGLCTSIGLTGLARRK